MKIHDTWHPHSGAGRDLCDTMLSGKYFPLRIAERHQNLSKCR